MRLFNFIPLAHLKFASVLVEYDAARGEDPTVLGLRNLQGWHRANWPSAQGMNSSVFYETRKDPSGIPAAHVHKDAHFTRAEYHALKDKTAKDKVYYIGYHVRFDDVDSGTIAFQCKTVPTDNIPIALVFQKDTDTDEYHTIHLNAQVNPTEKGGSSVWSKKLDMGKPYRFGIVVNTSQKNEFIQIYFNGKLSTLVDPSTGQHTQKLAGNFWPGPDKSSDPKFGLYDGKMYKECNSYIYNVVIGTQLSDIAKVAGIQS